MSVTLVKVIKNINIIEKNKVSGQVFITLIEEKLLASLYILLSGSVEVIVLLIKKLICKVQATYANKPQNPISTSKESF
ncbi:11737_t:CDS:2 [Funneliformis mosseae]|uniref:11737_t:CDS:1 n=1 Tax=Funneliformis mosseae TaxID=27381 RepID=A0A9N8ZGH3_FUNMO|nr:11737_t:CDS:2 [Funneliformis mosseae]